MLTGIILFFIIGLISVPMYLKLQTKYIEYPWKASIIYAICIIIIVCVVVFLPILISARIVINNAETIYSYPESGTVYYDSNEDVYFYSECSLWNYFHIFNRVDIDYDFGKNIHDAKNIIDASEGICISMIK